MTEIPDISIRMQRVHLDEIPDAPLPDGLHFRYYQPGDREAWVALYDAAESIAEISCELFDKEFYGDEDALSKRMVFIYNDANDFVATSTAWYDDQDHNDALGRVHWVAMHPDYQGRGLAKPLLSETLRALKTCGHSSAYLMTSTSRIPALSLYMRYGFEPQIRNEEDIVAWRTCMPALRSDAQEIVSAALK